MNIQIKERVFVVTGGSRGIGRSIVETLLDEGAIVATCARSLDELHRLKANLPKAHADRLLVHAADVSDHQAMAGFVNEVVACVDRLDGVVANAGVGKSRRLLDASEHDWMGQISTKIMGVVNLVKPSVGHIAKSDAGRIVIMNSVTAKWPERGMAVVSATRAAVANLSHTLALDLANTGICVNVINIGVIDTDRQRARYQQSATRLSYEAWCQEEAAKRHIALGRMGHPSEISPFVALCLSPLASYMTGATIDLHGGR